MEFAAALWNGDYPKRHKFAGLDAYLADVLRASDAAAQEEESE
jgi:hypothetical protein